MKSVTLIDMIIFSQLPIIELINNTQFPLNLTSSWYSIIDHNFLDLFNLSQDKRMIKPNPNCGFLSCNFHPTPFLPDWFHHIYHVKPYVCEVESLKWIENYINYPHYDEYCENLLFLIIYLPDVFTLIDFLFSSEEIIYIWE